MSPGKMLPRKMPQGKVPPGKLPPEINPPGKLPQGKLPPGKLPPRKIDSPENCPPLPLKKYFVKLLHVMEYLSGENFVNFNFRQS